MQRKRCLLAVFLFLTAPLASAFAQIDPDDGEAAPILVQRAVAGPAEPECDFIGDYGALPPATFRYRGDIFHFDFPATLKEIRMELAFTGTTDLHVAIHRKDPTDGSYKRYPEGSIDFVIGGAVGLGAGAPKFYTTGILEHPVELEAGFDYAIAFAWGDKSVAYGRDQQNYPVPFRAGQILGLVGRNAGQPPAPLIPDSYVSYSTLNTAAYSMQLCFEPSPGACCSTALGRCEQMFETDCLASAGSSFHGERIPCAETPCSFGTCCDPCDACHSPYTPEACASGRPDRDWTAFDCPAGDPELLCPIVTGACCRGTACTQECRYTCEHPPSPILPGTYRGDGTDCTPNVCPGALGACCVTGGCLNRTQSSCTSSNGIYKGPGTTCLTLPPELECGGACCRGFKNNNLDSCQPVATRADCAIDPEGGFPYSAYRGDRTTCPSNCNDRDEVACCLPDGNCINTTSGFCTASWVKGEPHPGVVCEDQPTICPSRISCCFDDGQSCKLMTPNGCTVVYGGSAGAGNTCATDACAGFIPTGACCGDMPGQCSVSTEAQCNTQGGLYQGDTTNCDAPATTCPGFGACCRDNGDCLDGVTSAQCIELGGEYQNDTSVCDGPAVDCDQRGACCATTGTCFFITESQCNEIDPLPGLFLGIGVACAADACSTGACCLKGVCEIRTPGGCLGVYRGDDTTCDGPNPCPCTNNADCDDVNACTDDICNLENVCVFTNNTNPCDDQNACTTIDTCSKGTCVGSSPLVCDDVNACTDDTCDPATGCVNTPNTCDDGNQCTDDSCDPASGCVFTNNTNLCDDGDACTTNDTCAGGSCVGGAPPNCDDLTVCTDDTCEPATGCVNTPNPCDDTNACTDDLCDPITGCAFPPIDCDDGDACTFDGCDPATGCTHSPVTPTCGDGTCECGETCVTCTQDCGGCTTVTVLTWESVITHTRTGQEPIEVPLDIRDNANCTGAGVPYTCCTDAGAGSCTGSFSEPRGGVGGGINKLVVTFDGPLDPATAMPSNVTVCGNDSSGSPVDLSGVGITTATANGETKMEISFAPALPGFARYRVVLSTNILGAGGGPIEAGIGGLSRILTALRGDANGDRRVNATDVGGIRSFVPRDPINPAIVNEVRADVNNDKRINATDVGGARSLVGSDARSIPDPVCP